MALEGEGKFNESGAKQESCADLASKIKNLFEGQMVNYCEVRDRGKVGHMP